MKASEKKAELNLKHFLFQVAVWVFVAAGLLGLDHPLGIPRAVSGALLLTLFLGFVTLKLFPYFDREQRFIAVGVTLSSAVVLLLLTAKFYWFDFELRALHFIGIFMLPLIVSVLTNGWRKED